MCRGDGQALLLALVAPLHLWLMPASSRSGRWCKCWRNKPLPRHAWLLPPGAQSAAVQRNLLVTTGWPADQAVVVPLLVLRPLLQHGRLNPRQPRFAMTFSMSAKALEGDLPSLLRKKVCGCSPSRQRHSRLYPLLHFRWGALSPSCLLMPCTAVVLSN